MSKSTPTPALNTEWSHKIAVDTLPDQAWRKTIVAEDQECRDLARRLGMQSVEGLEADMIVERVSGGKIHVAGTVRGLVRQPCVVTTVETIQNIEETFESWYADKDAAISLARIRHDKMSQMMDSEVPMLDEYDDPEPVLNGQIDLGELAAQYLSLAVNPYPRADGVTEEESGKILTERGVAPESRNPFAALKKWKEDRGRDDKS
jgi:hypothetical protein